MNEQPRNCAGRLLTSLPPRSATALTTPFLGCSFIAAHRGLVLRAASNAAPLRQVGRSSKRAVASRIATGRGGGGGAPFGGLICAGADVFAPSIILSNMEAFIMASKCR